MGMLASVAGDKVRATSGVDNERERVGKLRGQAGRACNPALGDVFVPSNSRWNLRNSLGTRSPRPLVPVSVAGTPSQECGVDWGGDV